MNRKTAFLTVLFLLFVFFSSKPGYSEISHQKVVKGSNGFEMLVDYDKMTITVDDQEIPIIVDGDAKILSPAEMDSLTWVHLPYDRFDVYVDSVYYYNNTPAIDDFFDKFEPRYELMESITGWSSEEYYGLKLKINVTTDNSCSWGWAYPGNAMIYFSDPLYASWCGEPSYYENGTPYYGNPGELGDNWDYMNTALHEALHSINPLPIYGRLWLTEGFAEYNMYNTLSNYYGNSYPDITQETADYYLYHGVLTPQFRWEEYVANDYHDGTTTICRDWDNKYTVASCNIYNNQGCAEGYACEYDQGQYYCVFANCEIQESLGYDITAWMFSMLRDNYSLNWSDFYRLIDNNPETMDKCWPLRYISVYYTDMHIIDLFERATGIPMYPVFRYDGPQGPGWGVRNWTDLDWYADLAPNLAVSDTVPPAGDSIQLNATVYNYGDVSLNNVSVRFYSDSNLINEQFVSVYWGGFTTLSTRYSASEGLYDIRVVVNEGHIKIEKDYNNNEDSVMVYFLILGDANGDGKKTVSDVVYLINYLFKGGPAPVPVLKTGDCNCDGKVTVSDVVYLINYLFKSGPPPAC